MTARIYLIGFMGSGKSTYGKSIARMMDYAFIDMDDWIESRAGMRIPDIFSQHGEDRFRELETEAIAELSKTERTVIATGGGAPCFGNNMEIMKESGLTVYLKLSPEALVHRLKGARDERPLLARKTEKEMLETIRELLARREPYYNQADMIIDGLERVTERVVNAIQRRSK